MRPVAQVDEILPPKPKPNVIQKHRIGDGRVVFDQLAVPPPPGLFLWNEERGEPVRAKLGQLRPRNILDQLVQAKRARLRAAECRIERLLVNREGISGLGDRRPMGGILDRVREHQETRFRFRQLLIL